MTATLLFVDGHPVPYSIEQDADRFTLYPTHDTHPEVIAPRLKAYQANQTWIVEGCHQQDLYDQVVEDLEKLTPCP
jgi:hypothetical protein